MSTRHQLTLKTCRIRLSILQEFVDILLIKHLELLGTLVDLHTRLVLGIASVIFVVDHRFPVLEVMTDHPHIVILFSCRLLPLVFELRRLHQPRSIPMRHPRHPVQRPQLQMRIDIPNINLSIPSPLLRVGPWRLAHRIRLLKPITYFNRDLPILTLGLYPSQIWFIVPIEK